MVLSVVSDVTPASKNQINFKQTNNSKFAWFDNRLQKNIFLKESRGILLFMRVL
jgi:hypothetical protein